VGRIRAGKLRNRVTVEALAGGNVQPLGDPRESWSAVATRSASIEPVSQAGREYPFAGGIQADATTKVTMRYFAGLTPKHRLTMAGRVFEIKGVEPDELTKEFTVCYCREVV
jgi:SPP1 family predicted phage head-tail adaptor